MARGVVGDAGSSQRMEQVDSPFFGELVIRARVWWSGCVPVGCWAACSSGSIRVGPVITGTGGLLPASLEERPLERGLAAGLTGHLGLWEGRVGSVGASQHGEAGAAKDRRPRRWGPPGPVVPRGRAGSLARRRVAQGGQRRPGRPGFDDHQLVRPGMTVRDSATTWRRRSVRT